MEAREPFVEYVAQPQVLNISVLQKGIVDVLKNFAKMNLIRINPEEAETEMHAAYQSITPEKFTVKEKMTALKSLVGIVHSENPNLAEKLAKEERLARQ
ncbi:MAG: hypothetical protein FWC26_13640 [Fibromonadales bacterium]|nr:hypothetical protein [Fibromonadales bacterium]